MVVVFYCSSYELYDYMRVEVQYAVSSHNSHNFWRYDLIQSTNMPSHAQPQTKEIDHDEPQQDQIMNGDCCEIQDDSKTKKNQVRFGSIEVVSQREEKLQHV